MAPQGQQGQRNGNGIPATTGFDKDTGRATTIDQNNRHKLDDGRDQVALVDEPIELVVITRARPGGRRPPRPEELAAIEADTGHEYDDYALSYNARDSRKQQRLHKPASRRGARARGRYQD